MSSLNFKVEFWITHNEPWAVSVNIYGSDPSNGGINVYRAAHNLLRSHARVSHLHRTKYRHNKGKLGIVLSHMNGEPMDRDSLADIEAAERFNQFNLGWFANPIFGNGDYPDVLKWQVGNKSLEQGFAQSRLPAFTDEEKRMILGSADFLGYNMYTSTRVKASVRPLSMQNHAGDADLIDMQDPSWEGSGSSWLKVTPWGMRAGLNWIRSHYNNVPVYVTENGVSDNTGQTDDPMRINYYKMYINEVLKAIRLDGCDVRGYTAWSFMDNFEWMMGYSEHFGLHAVNFSDPSRHRTPKASAAYYTSIIENNGFVKPGNDERTSTTAGPESTETSQPHSSGWRIVVDIQFCTWKYTRSEWKIAAEDVGGNTADLRLEIYSDLIDMIGINNSCVASSDGGNSSKEKSDPIRQHKVTLSRPAFHEQNRVDAAVGRCEAIDLVSYRLENATWACCTASHNINWIFVDCAKQTVLALACLNLQYADDLLSKTCGELSLRHQCLEFQSLDGNGVWCSKTFFAETVITERAIAAPEAPVITMETAAYMCAAFILVAFILAVIIPESKCRPSYKYDKEKALRVPLEIYEMCGETYKPSAKKRRLNDNTICNERSRRFQVTEVND
ncbi:hypothetical protein DPMN_015476 [Dreissena polymorpha]|uniref:beta-glucosidase n=1 Tax=Dreissena polymorpha TaxID=45954 RepID=A0A9D4S673_DREPO|nr:hypothetical protein DPMN_015476 [Dreissena polymorpha]